MLHCFSLPGPAKLITDESIGGVEGNEKTRRIKTLDGSCNGWTTSRRNGSQV
jgi:hypothetical protein